MIELLSHFPTSVFTGLLVFCLTWWLISILVSGLDADADTDADFDGDGVGDHIGKALGLGAVPLPLALTLLAFGGWAASIVLQSLLATTDTPALALGTALAVLAGALVAGLVVLRLSAKPLSRLFRTEQAPSRSAAVGAMCRVRTLNVTSSFGDAEVLSGPTRGSIVRVRAADGRFGRGDTAHIIDFDEQTNTFVIDELDDVLRPPPT